MAITIQRENILLAPDHRPVRNLKEYVNQRGMEGLKKARSLKPERVIEEIKRSGLRGRGGGGFPTGVKWEGVYKHPCPVKYVCCNAAEGEPGTFKDRFLLRKNPYQMLEGLAIAIHAIGAKKGYIGIKEKFGPETKRLESALGEMIEAGFLEKTEIELVKGPADYLFGEQKALLEVIEGNLPMPRVLPPYVEGLFHTPHSANPTVVNNVETLSNIPHILSKGADWFSGIGPRNCPGTMVFTLCGDVKKPGIYELPMGTPFRVLVEDLGGGAACSKSLRAVFSGVSNPVLTPAEFDVSMDFDSMKKAGVGLGSAGFIVYDESVCMVKAALMFSTFLARESCGQCVPCKMGCEKITKYLKNLESGSGSKDDLKEIRNQCGMVENGSRCFLAAEENILISSLLDKFAAEFEAHLGSVCPYSRRILLPQIEDFDEADNIFSYEKADEEEVDALRSLRGKSA